MHASVKRSEDKYFYHDNPLDRSVYTRKYKPFEWNFKFLCCFSGNGFLIIFYRLIDFYKHMYVVYNNMTIHHFCSGKLHLEDFSKSLVFRKNKELICFVDKQTIKKWVENYSCIVQVRKCLCVIKMCLVIHKMWAALY